MRFTLIVGIVMTTTVGLRAGELTHVCGYRPPEVVFIVKPQNITSRALPAVGGVTFSLTFEEPNGEFADQHDSIEQLVMAAAAEWGQFLDGVANIEIELRFRDSDGIGGSLVLASAESSQYFFQYRTDDGVRVFMSGIIGEIAGLGDPNGEEFDSVININSDWLPNFSFDIADAVSGRHDLYSIILHELGHILGFTGGVSFGSGGDWKSTFDLNVEYDPDIDRFFFIGDAATANFGDRVWLADSPHVGDEIPNLMNATTNVGQRLSVGKLELAMLVDSELPIGLLCWSLPSLDEPDSDADGTPDCIDECPDNAALDFPGSCGCDTDDTDEDGILDCLDECPNDSLKVAVGTCGCGTLDTDSDSDGTPDCNDNCPDDPDKIEPGECGCGEAEGTCTPMCGAGMVMPMAFAMLALCMVRRRL